MAPTLLVTHLSCRCCNCGRRDVQDGWGVAFVEWRHPDPPRLHIGQWEDELPEGITRSYAVCDDCLSAVAECAGPAHSPALFDLDAAAHESMRFNDPGARAALRSVL